LNYALWDMAAPSPDAGTKPASLAVDAATERQAASRALPINQCDRLAAMMLDPDKPVALRGLVLPPKEPEAVGACRDAVAQNPGVPRYVGQLAMATWGAGDGAGARKLFEEAAAKGHAASSFGLTVLNGRGIGGEADDVAALRHLREAEARGYLVATIALAEVYERGNDILAKDSAKAASLSMQARARLEAAMRAGDPDAAPMLAQLLLLVPSGAFDAALVGKYILEGLASQSRVAIAMLKDGTADSLSIADRTQAERLLADRGFDPGPADGIIDTATLTALDSWEKASPAGATAATP
jgi:hypothetical protein